MNSVTLIGRLAREPELGYTQQTQTACCKFTLAVDRPKRNGEDQGADFIRIIVWGKMGESCDKYLSKGRQVAVEGRIQTGSYKNKDGQTVYTTDVVASRVQFIGSSRNTGEQGPQTAQPADQTEPEQLDIDGFEAVDDDIPF